MDLLECLRISCSWKGVVDDVLLEMAAEGRSKSLLHVPRTLWSGDNRMGWMGRTHGAGEELGGGHFGVVCYWKNLCFGVKVLPRSHLVAACSKPEGGVLDRLKADERRWFDVGRPNWRREVDLRPDECLEGENHCIRFLAPRGARKGFEDLQPVRSGLRDLTNVR